MEDYRVIHNQDEEDGIDYRESFDKSLMGEKVVLQIRHDSSGGTDSFSGWVGVVDSVNAVSDNEDMTSPYTITTDYLVTSEKAGIGWSPAGAEPAVGAVYFVSVNWVKEFEQTESDKVDGNTSVITVGGFNPESDIRGIIEIVDSLANLNEVLDASETDVDVTDGTKFVIDDIIQIESEQMLVTNISVNTLTVVRDYNDTTGAAHANGLDIYKWTLTSEVSKYPKSGDTRVKQDLDKPTRFSEIEIRPVRNTANPFGELRLFNQTNKDDLRFNWNKFLHRIVGVAQTGTSTNYCYFVLKEKEEGSFDYMDDYAEATKWTYDRLYQSGVSHSGSQLDFGANAVLIYEFNFPFLVKDFEVTLNVGAGTAYITYMTESDYSVAYDGVGNTTSGVAFDVYEKHFFIKISINTGNISDIRFESNLRSAGCVLGLEIGSNTIEYGIPTNARLDVILRHQERSLRLEQETDTRVVGGLARRLSQLEMHDHVSPYLSGGMAKPVGKVIIPRLDYTGQAIQDAIDSLPPSGGSVFIPAGTWILTANITTSKTNVKLIGAGYSSKISGNYYIQLDDGFVIENLTFTDGVDVYITVGYGDVLNNVFEGGSYQILVYPSASASNVINIKGNTFYETTSTDCITLADGGGSGANVNIEYNTFIANGSSSSLRFIEIEQNSNDTKESVQIRNNTFIGRAFNSASNYWAVHVREGSVSGTIEEIIITGNKIVKFKNGGAGTGYGIQLEETATGSIDRVLIMSNQIEADTQISIGTATNVMYLTATDSDPLNQLW